MTAQKQARKTMKHLHSLQSEAPKMMSEQTQLSGLSLCCNASHTPRDESQLANQDGRKTQAKGHTFKVRWSEYPFR
eukprot:6475828-Amphidinium_carterae.1